jgi:hypothetical protein
LSKRDSLVKKIQALMGKTVKNGCTEEEALTAAAHVETLMEEYDLTHKDIEKEIRQQTIDRDRRPFGHDGPSGRRHYPAIRNCVRDIANFFDCESWYHGTDLVFFGTKDDTGLAHSMVTMLQSAIDYETSAFLKRPSDEHPRTRRASFEHGITGRLSDRLEALKRARTEADKKAHEALATEHAGPFHAPVVVTKKLVVRERFEALGIKLYTSRVSQSTGSHAAYRAGQAAGDRITITAARGLLGKKRR